MQLNIVKRTIIQYDKLEHFRTHTLGINFIFNYELNQSFYMK